MSHIPTRVRGTDRRSTLELSRIGDGVIVTIKYDGKPATYSISVDLLLLAQAVARESKTS